MCNHSYMPISPQNSKYPLISVQWHILYQYFLFQTLKLTKTCSEFLPSKNDAKIVIQIVNLFENTHQCLIYPWDKFPSVSPNAYSMTKYSPKIGEIVHVLDFQKKRAQEFTNSQRLSILRNQPTDSFAVLASSFLMAIRPIGSLNSSLHWSSNAWQQSWSPYLNLVLTSKKSLRRPIRANYLVHFLPS